MATCLSTPTATQTTIVTSGSVSTGFSTTVSTAAATVTTILSPSCASPSGTGTNATCLSTTTVTSLSTVAGGLTTIQVPVPITIDVLQTEIKTLFAPCTEKSSSASTSQSSSTTPILVSTSVLSTSTPPPTIITSESTSTGADGSVVVKTQVVTSTLPPSAIYVPTTVPNTQTQNNGNHSSSKVGPAIGGAVGGAVLLIGIVAFVWFIIQRRKRWDDMFDKDDEIKDPARPHKSNRRFSLDVDTEPKPYQYGLVGLAATPGPHTPPSSPPPSGHNAQLSGDMYSHSRATSTTPLMAVGALGGSRPSSAGSAQLLRPASEVTDAGGRPLSHASDSDSRNIPSLPNPRASYHPPSEAGQLIDLDARAGSPTSIADQRRLTLVNAQPPLSPTTTVGSADRLSPPPNGQRRAGKGHLRTSSKPVVMHTDGGRVDQGSSGAMPPAYEN